MQKILSTVVVTCLLKGIAVTDKVKGAGNGNFPDGRVPGY
jgi:hypothetical protein